MAKRLPKAELLQEIGVERSRLVLDQSIGKLLARADYRASWWLVA
jgi:hypothetical protein